MNREQDLFFKALIDSDKKTFKELVTKNPNQQKQRNRYGFTALEMAQFLGKEEFVKILQPQEHRTIHVLRRGTHTPKKLSKKEFENFFFIKYCSHLLFSSVPSFEQTLQNCPWILKGSWLGEENRDLAKRYQPELTEGKVADVLIRWINEDLGYGLFACADLPANIFVGEFTGRVRPLLRQRPDHNAYCFHYPTKWWSWNYTIIDALKHGNEMRFINHSDTPNLQPLCACDRELLHIIFITKTAIKAGTQLTYDYGCDFWRHRLKTKVT